MEHPILFITVILEQLGWISHSMDGIGKADLLRLSQPHITYAWFVMAFLMIMPKLTMGKIEMIPGKGQNFWEALIGGMESFMAETMGKDGAKMMFPMLATFGLFILVSNLVGLMPLFMSPTSNINVTLACTI
ncbi:MAG: F0F1 ATP synthase subunit A, partial [Desulfobulbaceae bacterium]|nr:F0F1 ATP synthase subunit A [Desulfobulbaceae bacterium]